MIMKQTVEEAAHLFAEARSSGSTFPAYYHGFMAGAEWQSKHSPWISVKEQLPNDYKEKLILLKDRQVRVAILDEADNEYNTYCFWYDREADETFELEDVIAWMPIPSFDEILEANKDVLQRMKEKGD